MVAMVLSMSSTSTLSVSSSLSWPEGAPVMASTRATSSHKAGAAELAGADVHGHGQVAAQGSFCQLASSLQAWCSTQRPSGTISPVSSARAMKSGGTTPRWVASSAAALPRPQSRRFGAPGAGSAEKLVLRQGCAQVGLQRCARRHHGLHLRVKEPQGVAPCSFGLVHGQVGLFEQLAHGGGFGAGEGAMPTLGVLRYW